MWDVPIRSLLAQSVRIYAIIGVGRGPTPRCCQIPRVVQGLLKTATNRKKHHRKSLFYRGRRRGLLDLAGGTVLIIRRLIVPLTVAVIAHAGQGFAQGAFPA